MVLFLVFLPFFVVKANELPQSECFYLSNGWNYQDNRMNIALRCSGYFHYTNPTTANLYLEQDGSFVIGGCFAWGVCATPHDELIFVPLMHTGGFVNSQEELQEVLCTTIVSELRQVPWENVVQVTLKCSGDLNQNTDQIVLFDALPDGLKFHPNGSYTLEGCLPETSCQL